MDPRDFTSVSEEVGAGEMCPIPTAEERAANWLEIRRMHPTNRFRLMFGQPLMDEAGDTMPVTMHNPPGGVME